MRIFITGDTHGQFYHVQDFCYEMNTSKEDILIILGDAGINYSGEERDKPIKELLQALPITFLCVHGNHEQRPETIDSYELSNWHGGRVYKEFEYPNILFAKDGEIYDLNGLKTMVIGGAYSIDKDFRLLRGWHWFPDEQPSPQIKEYVEKQLEKNNWAVDVILSHTAPLKYEPTELFISNVDQSKIDKTTEEWLDKIEDKLNYQKWYFGHYHGEKKINKMELMYLNFDEFCKDILRKNDIEKESLE